MRGRKEEEKRGLLSRFNSSANHMVFRCFLTKNNRLSLLAFFPSFSKKPLCPRYYKIEEKMRGSSIEEASSSSAAQQRSSGTLASCRLVGPPSNGMPPPPQQPPPLFCRGFACYQPLVYIRPAQSRKQHLYVLETTWLQSCQQRNRWMGFFLNVKLKCNHVAITSHERWILNWFMGHTDSTRP